MKSRYLPMPEIVWQTLANLPLRTQHGQHFASACPSCQFALPPRWRALPPLTGCERRLPRTTTWLWPRRYSTSCRSGPLAVVPKRRPLQPKLQVSRLPCSTHKRCPASL